MTGFHRETLSRLEARVGELKRHFQECLAAFHDSELFSGPSQYFHLKTLACRARHRSVVEAFNDDQYLDSLYATLTAWGLHRMGPGNAKLRDITEIRGSLIRHADRLGELERLQLSELREQHVDRVAKEVWAVLRDLRITRAKAFLVANSKALHHALPGLLPPIDREYTLSFFFGNTTVDGREEEAFHAMFPSFWEIARSKKAVIEDSLRRKGWNSSETKVIDNAIVGYWRRAG